MGCKQDLEIKLKQLDPQTVSSENPAVISCPLDHGRVECEVVANDLLAAVFARIEFHADNAVTLSTDQLTALGQDLATRLNYLLEPISPIEIDGDGVVLQMRSLPPSDEGNNVRSFYELLVRSNMLSLQRYTAVAGAPRTAAEMTLTHETFTRLVTDLAAAHQAAVA